MLQRHLLFLPAILSLAFAAMPSRVGAGDGTGREGWSYLDNGQIRIGIKSGSGGAIGYLSPSGSEKNLLNHHDHGRLVQQSYYGQPDGSIWDKQPWRWNPVQGGDYKGTAARVLELKQEPNRLYAKTLPRNWAGCTDLPEVTMEQWIELDGPIAHVRYRMTYAGKAEHPKTTQEIPAVFVEPELDTLVLYDGGKPWTGDALHRSKPGWPNESRKIAEHWAAYIGTDGKGVGAYVPVADTLTCYRFGKGGSEQGACSYFAPLTEFAITPGFSFDYDLYLTIGSAEEIRGRFLEIHRARDEAASR